MEERFDSTPLLRKLVVSLVGPETDFVANKLLSLPAPLSTLNLELVVEKLPLNRTFSIINDEQSGILILCLHITNEIWDDSLNPLHLFWVLNRFKYYASLTKPNTLNQEILYAYIRNRPFGVVLVSDEIEHDFDSEEKKFLIFKQQLIHRGILQAPEFTWVFLRDEEDRLSNYFQKIMLQVLLDMNTNYSLKQAVIEHPSLETQSQLADFQMNREELLRDFYTKRWLFMCLIFLVGTLLVGFVIEAGIVGHSDDHTSDVDAFYQTSSLLTDGKENLT